MKKRLLLIILAAITAFTSAACSSYGSLKVSGNQDTSYAITSNGGLAVGYGNYVYFVNGYRATEDAEGKNNKFGEVTQGGIFRAEFSGTSKTWTAADQSFDETKPEEKYALRYPAGVKSFAPNPDMELAFEKNTNVYNPYYYFNLDNKAINTDDTVIEEAVEGQPFMVDEIKTQQIVSKGIAADTSGNGGLFIFDNYIYYASRNNERDKNDVVKYGHFDFYRTKLDGSGTQRLYTTSSEDIIQYAFYKFNGSVYLVVQDGADIVSVKVTNKAQTPVKIAESVSKVVLPIKTDYHKGISENTIFDYIFFTRAIDDDDAVTSGVIAECMRPDGSKRTEILYNADTLDLLSVRDNSLYYTEKVGLNTALRRSEPDFSNGISVGEFALNSSLVFANSASYTSIIPFRERGLSGYTTSNTAVFTAGGKLQLQRGSETFTLVSSAASVVAIENGYVYYTGDSGLQRISLATATNPVSEPATERSLTTNSFFKLDFVNGYMFFLAAERFSWATEYVFVKKHSSRAETEEIFIGKLEQENPDIAIHDEHDEENHREV